MKGKQSESDDRTTMRSMGNDLFWRCLPYLTIKGNKLDSFEPRGQKEKSVKRFIERNIPIFNLRLECTPFGSISQEGMDDFLKSLGPFTEDIAKAFLNPERVFDETKISCYGFYDLLTNKTHYWMEPNITK